MTVDNSLAQDAGLTIGNAIAKMRKQKDLTQEEVAEKLGIGVEAVSRIERGVVIPTVQRLFLLADIFKCDAADLLTEASYRRQDQALKVAKLIEPLSADDRQLVTDMVERLALRLATKS